MDGRLTGSDDHFDLHDEGAGEPQAIGDILAELLVRYRARFPEVNITVVEVPATT